MGWIKTSKDKAAEAAKTSGRGPRAAPMDPPTERRNPQMWTCNEGNIQMTENQLRQKAADTINAWIGAAKGGVKHLDILKVYNNFRPLARGYKVQAKDGYCAATVSAAYMGRKGSKAARAIELLDIIIKVYYCKYGKGYSALLKSG